MESRVIKVPRVIRVGEKIPSSLYVTYTGGSGSVNLGSCYMDMLFRRELAKLQSEPYEFSELCRNENEKQAMEKALEASYKKKGWVVEWI